jgi:hypothetical protein
MTHPQPVSTSRQLLRQLRDLMGRELEPRDRLREIVKLVSNGLVAEVCSTPPCLNASCSPATSLAAMPVFCANSLVASPASMADFIHDVKA